MHIEYTIYNIPGAETVGFYIFNNRQEKRTLCGCGVGTGHPNMPVDEFAKIVEGTRWEAGFQAQLAEMRRKA